MNNLRIRNIYRLLVKFWLVALLFFGVANAEVISLDQKIGQLLLIGFDGLQLQPNDAIVQAIMAQQIGGVVLFDYNFKTKTYRHNIQNPQQLKQLTEQLQYYAKLAAKQHHNNLYPLFIGIDYEGGNVNRLKAKYGFPKTLSATEIGQGSTEQAQNYANQMAITLQKEGINLNFAPVVDIDIYKTSSKKINPNPVIGRLDRSFSNAPQQVVKYAEIFSKAYKNHHIICVYKHFPGHGSSTSDTHEGFVDVTKTWKTEELIPYQQLLNQAYSCPMVMVAHVVNYKLDSKGYPATLSAAISTELLRQKLKFDGIIITDDLQMKAITEKYTLKNAVLLAINAGDDILMFGNQLITQPQDPKQIIELIDNGLKSHNILPSQIDAAFDKIMQLKTKMRET